MTELQLADVLDTCVQIEQSMVALRSEVAMLDDWNDPDKYLLAVADVRSRLDLAETVMKDVRQYRRRVRARTRRAREAREDAYDNKLAQLTEGAVRREYESIRDREVQARTHVLGLTREVRAWEAAQARADEAFETVREAYFGLKDVRGELLDLLRFLPWVSHLEH